MVKPLPKFSNTKSNMRVACCILLLTVFARCDDFVTVPPPGTELVQQSVFEEDETALAAMAGVYLKLSNSNLSFADGGSSSVTIFASLYSDELTSSAASTSTSPLVEFYY